jgi:hypothetical protein
MGMQFPGMPFFHVILRVLRPTTIAVYTSREPHGVTSLRILHRALYSLTSYEMAPSLVGTWELSYRAERLSLSLKITVPVLCVVAQYTVLSAISGGTLIILYHCDPVQYQYSTRGPKS